MMAFGQQDTRVQVYCIIYLILYFDHYVFFFIYIDTIVMMECYQQCYNILLYNLFVVRYLNMVVLYQIDAISDGQY